MRGVKVRSVRLSDVADLPHAWLSPAERERALAYDDGAPRRRFLAGRLGVRQVLGESLGLDPAALELSGRCPRCGEGPHGRPQARHANQMLPLRISWSRHGDWLVVAWADAERVEALGVDILPGAGEVPGGTRRAARTWALAEARGKAAGTGIVGDTPARGKRERILRLPGALGLRVAVVVL